MPGHYRAKPSVLILMTGLGGVTPQSSLDASPSFAKCPQVQGLAWGVEPWGVERSSTMRKYLRAAGCSSSHHALALSALPLGRQVDDSAGEKQ